MFGQILGALGGFLGKELFGGGIFSTIGRYAGRALGNYLTQNDYDPEEFYKYSNIKDSFGINIANYGETIPLIFGHYRVSGKIIWADKIKQVAINTTNKSYFTNSNKPKAIYHNTNFEYYLSFAVAICEGEISDLGRIWLGDEVINIGDYKFRLYKGNDKQAVDPLINAQENGKAPAYRDLAYIVFEGINLSEFDNQIPNFSFEVIRKCNIKSAPSVEDNVKAMVMIPGSGEYVYDTIVQHKIIKSFNGTPVGKHVINSHNYYNIANSVHSLDQLQLTCQNVEWVAPVVCWFGDNLNAGKCTIKPYVEYQDDNLGFTESWQVGRYSRHKAKLISRDKDNNPSYGGTVNDASVVRYLKELRRRGLKIMFYPMIMLDLPSKPWRGHITGDNTDIGYFFESPKGYNNFILHYARLVKDDVDAFIIGSELIGMTKVGHSIGNYPAVDALILLAQKVKKIVGKKVAVTYAADWSEYHHTEGGWYNLDPLWACPYIDFIGIDAYFPVTNNTDFNITTQDIITGWGQGEGYDYYLDQNKNQQPLSPAYAWKNVKYWWENYHINPDGKNSQWLPKSKKIWFTEFGFPSIDKATNQPNIFFDPKCFDGGIPLHSSGAPDFSIQRRAIKAFMQYWGEEEYIEQMFLWTWDARPYPAWPHLEIWRDGDLWEKGHWVNNKFGTSSLAAIILELSARCSINSDQVKIDTLDENIAGFAIEKESTAMQIINLLRIGYFFDIKTSNENDIICLKRALCAPHVISTQELIKIANNSYYEEIEIAEENIINKVNIYFVDHNKNYKTGYVQVNNEHFSNKNIATVILPLVLSFPETARLGKLILNNAHIENKIIKFILPIQYISLEPTDVVILSDYHSSSHRYIHHIRILSVEIKNLVIEVIGIVDDLTSYYLPNIDSGLDIPAIQFQEQETDVYVLDLPINIGTPNPYLMVYLTGNKSYDLYAGLKNGNQAVKYHKITSLHAGAVAGDLIDINQNTKTNIFLIDRLSSFTVYCPDFISAVKLHDWNLCLIGQELIRFKEFQEIDQNIYKIFFLIRGLNDSEEFMYAHRTGQHFIMLEAGLNIIEVSNQLVNKYSIFKLNNTTKLYELYFQNLAQKLRKPYVKSVKIVDNKLILDLCRREHPMNINRNTKYLYIIHLNNKFNIKSESTHIEIDLHNLGLSGSISVDIIAKSDGFESMPNMIYVIFTAPNILSLQ